MTKDQIRTIFLANGFTVKSGETDLKPYVYAAAEALLAPTQGADRIARLEEANTLLHEQVDSARAEIAVLRQGADARPVAYIHRWPGCGWELDFADEDGNLLNAHSKAIPLIFADSGECAHEAGFKCENATRDAAPSDAQENPLLDTLKHALGLLTLHGHEREARDLGTNARLILAASAPREKT